MVKTECKGLILDVVNLGSFFTKVGDGEYEMMASEGYEKSKG